MVLYVIVEILGLTIVEVKSGSEWGAPTDGCPLGFGSTFKTWMKYRGPPPKPT